MTEKAAKKAQGYPEKRLEKLKDENLALKKKMGLIRDENKALKKAVKKSGLMIDAVTACLFLVQEGKIIHANRAALDLFGYSAQEVIGLDFMVLIPPRPAPQTANLHRKRLAEKPVPDQVETNLLSKNGPLIPCDVTVNKIRLNGRNAFLVNIFGIEERKKREEVLIQTKKMDALVTMAEGVTRTLGQGIRALSKDLRLLKEAGESANKAFVDGIDQLDQAALQIAETAGRLEQFSRTKINPSRVHLFDLQETVKEAVAFMSLKLKDAEKNRGIKVVLKTYLRSVSPVKGDPNEIRE
ncbi:MAG: PAS domain S-box protein, partial [Pseudomonadota bacterium]